jgi:hypothetical protein
MACFFTVRSAGRCIIVMVLVAVALHYWFWRIFGMAAAPPLVAALFEGIWLNCLVRIRQLCIA